VLGGHLLASLKQKQQSFYERCRWNRLYNLFPCEHGVKSKSICRSFISKR
jgi:hypothetical protein